MSKIVFLFKTGHRLEYPQMTHEHFQLLVKHFNNFKKFFTIDNRMWIRKKDVSCFFLEEEENERPNQG